MLEIAEQRIHNVHYGYGFRVTRKEVARRTKGSDIVRAAKLMGEEQYPGGYMLQGVHVEREWTAVIRGSVRTMRKYIDCPMRHGCRLCDVIIVTRKLRGGNLWETLSNEPEVL